MAGPRTPPEALAFFAGMSPSVIRLGLDRIRAALAALGHPERRIAALQVAGTNGKGSTCAFAAAALQAQGHKVGLYTSPHLHRVNERIRVDGEEISDALLGRRILEVLERYPEAQATPPPLTYFEFGTLVALWHFAQEQVDVAVLETGLGGRLDATTAAARVLTALTPISFDHMDALGDTLAKIAQEKAGILQRGVPAVSSRQPPEALEVISRVAQQLEVPLRLEGRDFALEPESPAGGSFCYHGAKVRWPRLRLGLRAPHQAQNAAVALACLEWLAERGVRVEEEKVRTGLSAAVWPGRFEVFGGAPPLVLDGAHNPGGAQALASALKTEFPGAPVHLVFGVLADKEHRPMLQALFPACASVHLTPVDNPRTLLPQQYEAEARAACSEVALYASAAAALEGACRRAAPGDVVVCTGSLYLVGAVRSLVTKVGAARHGT